MLADATDDQYPLHVSDRHTQFTAVGPELPPTFSHVAIPVVLRWERNSVRFNLRLDDRHEVRPVTPTVFLVTLAKVDYVAVVGLLRAGVNLLATDVGEDHFLVARVLVDESPHFGDRRRDAFRGRIVEGETHAEDDTSLEALALVGRERSRVNVVTAMEEKRRNIL